MRIAVGEESDDVPADGKNKAARALGKLGGAPRAYLSDTSRCIEAVSDTSRVRVLVPNPRDLLAAVHCPYDIAESKHRQRSAKLTHFRAKFGPHSALERVA